MLNLLSYWKVALAVVVTASAAYGLHSLDVNHIKSADAKTLAASLATAKAQCDKEKQVTTDVSHDFEAKNTILVKRLAALRVRPAACVPVTGLPTGGRDGAAQDPRLPKPHGVDAQHLIDYAGDAEQVGLQLDACQAFVRKERQ